MKFIKLIKASWNLEKVDEKDKSYYVIKGPEGIYKDEEGREYHFDTEKEAQTELDYLRAEHKYKKASNNLRFEVQREDWGKSDIFEGNRDRRFFIFDNFEGIPYQDDDGDIYYFDTFEEAQDECDELNERN